MKDELIGFLCYYKQPSIALSATTVRLANLAIGQCIKTSSLSGDSSFFEADVSIFKSWLFFSLPCYVRNRILSKLKSDVRKSCILVTQVNTLENCKKQHCHFCEHVINMLVSLFHLNRASLFRSGICPWLFLFTSTFTIRRHANLGLNCPRLESIVVIGNNGDGFIIDLHT